MLGTQWYGAVVVVVIAVISHIQCIGRQPQKLLYTMANTASGLLNREKNKNKCLAATNHERFGYVSASYRKRFESP